MIFIRILYIYATKFHGARKYEKSILIICFVTCSPNEFDWELNFPIMFV